MLTADDAQLALQHGVDGVIVSNHGGRQVDGAVAALDALVEVRDALPEAVVLMDGGIRSAADVLKAMALGADAVLLGRPYAYALAVGGQRGVEELIQNLMAEIDLKLALAGGAFDSRSRPVMAEQGVVLGAPGSVALEEIRSTTPGPGEVLVRIEATGVCHSDLHVIEEDGWGHAYPMLLGHEGAGTIEAVGDGVDGLAPGDRVVLGWKTACGGVLHVPARGAAAVQEAARCARPAASATTAAS